MNPRLIVVSGPLKGTVRALNGGPLSLGRDSTNQLSLEDRAVSRKHCTVSQIAGGEFEIADLDSHNGTWVNGATITHSLLQHGDRIRVGSCEFVFRTRAEEDGDLLQPLAGAARGSGLKTMVLDERSGLPRDASGLGRMARDLAAFFKIANVINSTRDLERLQQELMVQIAEVIPAELGVIVLLANLDDEPASICRWSRKAGAKAEAAIRDELVRQAIWERSAIYTAAGEGPANAENILCVPLVGVEKILGVIYLTSASRPFGEDHVHFLSSVSRIAAVTLENLLKLDSLRAENQRLRADAGSGSTLIGESKPMARLGQFIARVAATDSTVLIRGESGTGKELVARAIHVSSVRADKPFVAINCAAIPEALLESELFGHEKGAFTGATATKKGKLEVAEEGTLFLDEIGEMAPGLQAKLLRALQQREFERLGGNRLLAFNARVIAATNKNLEQAIKGGEFRQDLYYRLNVVSVEVPGLRERRDDIPLLALYFATKYAAKFNRAFRGIAPQARSLLMQYSWPGNVRELENAIEHALVLGLTDEILLEDLPGALLEEQAAGLSSARYHAALDQTKRQVVIAALEEAQGSHIEAARLLGLHPKYLHRLIRNLNLKSQLRGQG
jgi:transcriptional regulator with GAF, ATPase, and Fis domain